MRILDRIVTARVATLACMVIAVSVPAHAGRVVANHDEWTTSDTGYTSSGVVSTNNFVTNLATFLAGSGGNILVYSDVFALNQSFFKASLANAGFTVTYGKASSDLTGYDAVFLSETLPVSVSDLTAFVNGGGGVYIEAGTGFPGSVGEAARWNPFLASFGLQLDSVYNICCGDDPIDNANHALLNGVTQLYYRDGNTVSTTGGNPNASIIEYSDGMGLIGVYDSGAAVTSMPEPSTYFLVGAGLFAAYLKRRSVTR